MPEVIKVSPDELTLGDLLLFKRIAGRKFEDAFIKRTSPTPEPEDIIALVTIIKRKNDPAFTAESAEALAFGDLRIEFVGGDDPPTTPASSNDSPASVGSGE